MSIGTAGAIAQGVLLPLSVIVFGSLVNSFTSRSFDICSLNFTSLSQEYCRSGYQLTPSNYFLSLSLVYFCEK